MQLKLLKQFISLFLSVRKYANTGLNKSERHWLLYFTCIDTAWTWIVSGWENNWGSATRKENSPVLRGERREDEVKKGK